MHGANTWEAFEGSIILRSIVEDKVNARELLQHLQAASGQLSFDHVTAEAVDIASLAKCELELVVGHNLLELGLNGRRVSRDAAEPAERPGRFLQVALLDEVARRLRQEEHARDEDEGPSELHGDGDAVGARVVPVLGRVVDDGGEQQADGDGELVRADDGASDPLGSRLGLVQGHDGGQHADTEAGEEPAGNEKRQAGRDGLQDDAEDEDDGRGDEC